jgi:stearoyl-CoA desaturase (delta-9 desaturase)
MVLEQQSISLQEKIRYYYIDAKKWGIVWRNAFMFFVLHVVYIYGLYNLFASKLWYSWMFGYWYGILGLVGITCGAHRLWSHRAYKATVPLRIFLMICQSIAGQNDLYTWVRDHRLHHKFSESDADPHNSKRGFFFCHVGWLLTRKHPDIMIKGNTVDCSDILKDPVVAFQKKFYIFFYIFFCFLLPTLCCHYLVGDSWFNSFVTGSFGRYIVSLHSTWFVNSAAHMWGDRPYSYKIQPRENMWVSYATWGEGFHNYHHVFPFDYSISEMGWKFNPMKSLIDTFAAVGLAYDLKRPSHEVIEKTKKRILEYSPCY